MQVFVEDWGVNYGSPYLVLPDDTGTSTAVLTEDGPDLLFHPGHPFRPEDGSIAFVDGVRRGEASLWIEDRSSGIGGRGVAGAIHLTHDRFHAQVTDREDPRGYDPSLYKKLSELLKESGEPIAGRRQKGEGKRASRRAEPDP